MPKNIELSVDRDDDLGLIFIELSENSNPNFIITEKKIMIAPWMLGYILKLMLILDILHPKVLQNALDEYNDYKRREING